MFTAHAGINTTRKLIDYYYHTELRRASILVVSSSHTYVSVAIRFYASLSALSFCFSLSLSSSLTETDG